MFATFGRSWKLVKASWRVLQADRELLLFPVLSMIGVIIATFVLSVPLIASGVLQALGGDGEPTTLQTIIGLAITFVFYLVTYTIVIFSNTALIGAAMIRLDGGDPTVRDGFRIASERIGTIIGYAAIAATVGMILNALRNNDNFLTQILAGFLSMGWNLITFLVVPVLVMEDVGPIEAVKRSGSLLRQTWGEQITGSFSIGGIFFLITLGVGLLIGGPLIALASATGSAVVIGFVVAVVVLALVFINLIGGALNGIFQAALYRYAHDDKLVEFFDDEVIRGAFQPASS